MELDRKENRIELLLEKYFEGETSIAEENELKLYFSSADVAQHLEQYKAMFGYFSSAKEQKFEQKIPLKSKTQKVAWLSIAASVVILLGMFTFYNRSINQSEDLGTYNDPEKAFEETQKALNLLSKNVNVGVESMQYVKEYQDSKDLIFKN
ncbi:hypothetical protein D3C87_423080 [compost metagenome]|jgi:hypothetical protein|uniref:Uncharacterized protein n=1 Tax=Flavobacterium endophyticum TaxID=1540163 RepID=A0A495M003_9FLAO|nr:MULTISPECIES: hypothetical protein [Flavobacterium]RKS18440.1 hypothetical protein CLV94_3250 [Flavobacterium endophyticum]WDO14657.1 hypothetical protein MH928_08150 [Flavobacterium sp. WW92]